MNSLNHYAIFLSNQSDKNVISEQILSKKSPGFFANFNEIEGILFSKVSISEILEEEDHHGFKEIALPKGSAFL